MIKTIVKKIIFGRENGFRAKIFSQIFRAEDTSPNSSFSAPNQNGNQGEFDPSISTEKEAPKDFTPPDGFEVVCHVDSVKEGEIKEMIIAGNAICLTKFNETIFAFSNDCPHAGAPLSEGSCDKGQVACAYHGWVFEIETGECLTNPSYSIDTYEVLVEKDAVCVQV